MTVKVNVVIFAASEGLGNCCVLVWDSNYRLFGLEKCWGPPSCNLGCAWPLRNPAFGQIGFACLSL